MSNKNHTADIQQRAQKIYDYCWQTKAKFAEGNRDVTPEIVGRINNEAEGLSVVVMQLAGALDSALKRIEELENQRSRGGRDNNRREGQNHNPKS